MEEKQRTRISRYLSKVLRHDPKSIGLTLDSAGWVWVDDLLHALSGHDFPVTREQLEEVVTTNDKQRYAFDPTGKLIRANQGHSVTVDLGLEPVRPPLYLYHGTPEKTAGLVEREGLKKMQRQHVHLSLDQATAQKVGMRRGRPVIFQVRAEEMYEHGFKFFCSENGVWLTDGVPMQYLKRL